MTNGDRFATVNHFIVLDVAPVFDFFGIGSWIGGHINSKQVIITLNIEFNVLAQRILYFLWLIMDSRVLAH